MESLEEMDYATKLDLEGAYHHIRVEEELSKYFAIRFKSKDYICKGLPFGYL
jgi:hypothetical protein